MSKNLEDTEIENEDEVENFEEAKQKRQKRKMNQKQLDTVKNNMIVGNNTKKLKKKLAGDDEFYENLTLQNLEKIMNSKVTKEEVKNIEVPDLCEVKTEKKKKIIKKKDPENILANMLEKLNNKIDSFGTRLDLLQKDQTKTINKTCAGKSQNIDTDYYKILADRIIGKK